MKASPEHAELLLSLPAERRANFRALAARYGMTEAEALAWMESPTKVQGCRVEANAAGVPVRGIKGFVNLLTVAARQR